MKIKHTILAGCLLMMGMASCEMKDEILGNKGESTEMGVMNLDVLVDAKSNDIVTKADGTVDGGEVTVPAVSAKGYEVEINNASGLFKKIIYGTEKATLELPVGDYTLYAHAAGEAKETEAYYGGRNTLKIESGKSTDVSVVCKMLNTKIQLNYGVELQTAFKSWEISVTAGSKSKVFSCVSTSFAQPDPLFWIMDEGTTEIRVNFKGINSKGKMVIDNRVITKPALAENKNWLGGDALAINFKPKAQPELPDGVLGIEISAEVKWDGINDSVDVPVVDDSTSPKPEPEVPGPGGNTVDITLPRPTYNLPDDLSFSTDVVTFNAKSGLESLKVIIIPDNEPFKRALSVVESSSDKPLSFAEGVELVGNTDFENTMGTVVPGIKVPSEKGVKDYSFPIGNFLEVLNEPDFGPTGTKGHYFKIMATAVGGSEVFSKELYIIVKSAQVQ